MEGQGTPPASIEVGEELIGLITDTAAKTGLSTYSISVTLSDATGVDFVVQNGKLNITEKALVALQDRMAFARAKCRYLELPHNRYPTPAPRPPPLQPVAKPVARKPDDPTHVRWGYPFVVCFAFIMAALVIWASSIAPGSPGDTPKKLTEEDKFIRDAVTLQRMMDAGQKRLDDKFKKEYERQERNGR